MTPPGATAEQTGVVLKQVVDYLLKEEKQNIVSALSVIGFNFAGQAQNAAYTQAQFKSQVVCPAGSLASILFDCTNGVYIDVESYPAFTNVTINSQIDGSNNFINNMQYNPGGPGDIVVVRVFYQWPLFVTGLGYNISNLSGSKRLLVATAAFKNEPY